MLRMTASKYVCVVEIFRLQIGMTTQPGWLDPTARSNRQSFAINPDSRPPSALRFIVAVKPSYQTENNPQRHARLTPTQNYFGAVMWYRSLRVIDPCAHACTDLRAHRRPYNDTCLCVCLCVSARGRVCTQSTALSHRRSINTSEFGPKNTPKCYIRRCKM